MIAALYIDPRGPYVGREDVDAWDEERDARGYEGPWPVVAHPPCKRWGRWWYADGSEHPGNDGGLFAHALAMVHRWGGILEHPAYSHAWPAFGLPHPADRGWTRGLFVDGWACHVEQRHYGHRARKATWLYYVGSEPPPLTWGPGPAPEAYLTPPGRRVGQPTPPYPEGTGPLERWERSATPPAFAEVLIELASR